MRDRLYNRRYMETHVGMLVEQAQSRGTPLTLLVLDIDYFKSINDTYGHDAGHGSLRRDRIAERLRRRIASEPFSIQQGACSIEVTISIGIAALTSGSDAMTLLKRADRALYRAKRDGRNRVVPDAA